MCKYHVLPCNIGTEPLKCLGNAAAAAAAAADDDDDDDDNSENA
jgi:hypothetical protein